jgi:hypothetical protein
LERYTTIFLINNNKFLPLLKESSKNPFFVNEQAWKDLCIVNFAHCLSIVQNAIECDIYPKIVNLYPDWYGKIQRLPIPLMIERAKKSLHTLTMLQCLKLIVLASSHLWLHLSISLSPSPSRPSVIFASNKVEWPYKKMSQFSPSPISTSPSSSMLTKLEVIS